MQDLLMSWHKKLIEAMQWKFMACRWCAGSAWHVDQLAALHLIPPNPSSPLTRPPTSTHLQVFGRRGWFGRRSKNAFWAIKGTWLAIERDRLFCLLGPNGAGECGIWEGAMAF